MNTTRVKKTSPELEPLCVFYTDGKIGMLSRVGGKSSELSISFASDAVSFVDSGFSVRIVSEKGKKESILHCDQFHISPQKNGYISVYRKKGKKDDVTVIAQSSDLSVWTITQVIPYQGRVQVLYNVRDDNYLLIQEGVFISVISSPLLFFDIHQSALLGTSRFGQFDEGYLTLFGVESTKKGLLIMYDASITKLNQTLLQVGAILIDPGAPQKIWWRGEMPSWQGVIQTKKGVVVSPLGSCVLGGILYMYWSLSDGTIFVAQRKELFAEIYPGDQSQSILVRSEYNPILQPNKNSQWESEAVFNPAAFVDEEGVVHLLYRAMGGDGVSRIGHAHSDNGIFFSRKFPFPVYESTVDYALPKRDEVSRPKVYNPGYYTSGGGWAGAEDPRAVLIDDTIYMTYVAFGGWHSVRIAVTSISNADFKKGLWRWTQPVFISPPGEVHKNWVIFPEKIHGKYAVLHGIAPEIRIDYIDDFNSFDDSQCVKSTAPRGGRSMYWDNKMRGAGSPPIKTSVGWLLLYHAMDQFDPNKYKIGAMILDLNDPTKILHRSAHCLLSPEMYYENDGKPGVVYTSGAVVKGDDLFVYYGGGDKVVCVATTKLNDLLQYLTSDSSDYYSLQSVPAPIL